MASPLLLAPLLVASWALTASAQDVSAEPLDSGQTSWDEAMKPPREELTLSVNHNQPPANGQIDARARYFAKKDPYIQACLENPFVPNDRPLKIAWSTRFLCSKDTDSWKENTGGYYLKKSGGNIRLSADLQFNYLGDEKNRAATVARLEKTRGCMVDFFAKRGVSLSLKFRVDSGPPDLSTSNKALDLWDEYVRANSANWVMLRSRDRAITEEESCSLAIHEFGHAMGLDDTYPDSECPDRAHLGENTDIMNDNWKSLGTLRFEPRDIEAILQPLCGK